MHCELEIERFFALLLFVIALFRTFLTFSPFRIEFDNSIDEFGVFEAFALILAQFFGIPALISAK